ncbi:MAG TPA: hypothetical protein DEP28_01505 [Bacteroidetes bacterium]|nr:hypothetical protein [Bacteroidota bacterium]HCN36166.1 hypothetical protein [Bacteroidota bacterium]
MKKILLFFVFSFLFISEALPQLGWKTVNTNFSGRLYGITMTSVENLYTCGEAGRIYRSSNYGLNWTLANQNNGYYLVSIAFYNDQIGIAVGSNGKILRTSNAGINWNEISSGVTAVLTCVSLSPDGTGLISGDGGRIFKTQNFGLNWVAQFTGFNNMFFSVNSINNSIAYAAGDGKVYKTTLGGINWGALNSISGTFRSSSFIDANKGWIVGSSLYRTVNGGTSWDTLLSNISGIKSIKFINDYRGFMVGSGGSILRSNDGGNSWQIQQSPTINDLECIYVFNDNIAVACGAIGTVLWTENGGVNVNNISSEIPGSFNLHQNFPNPFNPSTKINFDLTEPGFVKLTVYDITGKKVDNLVEEFLRSGSYSVNWDSKNLPAGVYIYSINFFSPSGEKKFTFSRKMNLIK